MTRRAPYHHVIAPMLARRGRLDVDPRHIEAFIRIEHPTLDHLDRQRFSNEVTIALLCVDEVGPAEAEQHALSAGL